MKDFGYYFTLALYPLGFFVVLGSVQYLILSKAYDVQADRLLQPYVNGAPLQEVRLKIDRRPQSISIPSLNLTTSPNFMKRDRVIAPSQ